MHLELPIGCFIAALLVLMSLPWHWQARNVPTLSLIAWLFALNVIDGVNSVVWSGNVLIKSPVWCDIATKIQIGGNIALPISCLSLCIHLERISSNRQAQSTVHQIKSRRLLDVLLCWIVPIIYMALHYVVQGHRFDIVEDFGCRPSIYDSIQSIILVWAPPLLAVAGTVIYASLALHHFFQRRLAFARHLQAGQTALTPSRYFRLMAMAVTQIVWASFDISTNVAFSFRYGLRPWFSWADVHSNFSRIGQFPTVLISPRDLQWTYILWWFSRISAFFFFIFFAFGQEAVQEYKTSFRRIAKAAGRCFNTFRTEKSEKKLLPLFSPVSPPYNHPDSKDQMATPPMCNPDLRVPYCLSSLDQSRSIIITPGARFPVFNDTPQSFTAFFRSN